MNIERNKSLKKLNTFAIDTKAKYFVEIKNVNDIYRLIETEEFKNNKFFILGAGSNVLFTKDYDGIVININIKGIYIKESSDDYLILDVGAGEDWSSLVETCVKSRYHGIENLAMIPGKVGAAPVQNIGAYGIEQKDIFYSLTGVNLETRELKHLDYNDCDFSYRSSIFKKTLKDRLIITSVQYKLSRKENLNLSYKELYNEIKKFDFIKPDQRFVFDTVCRLRKLKLPDLTKEGNAGSFFKNPIVNVQNYYRLKEEFKNIPIYPLDEKNFKVSAGWLIEQAGLKGYKQNGAAISDKHALILVNQKNANGEQIFQLAKKIKDSVQDKFKIILEPEVIIL